MNGDDVKAIFTAYQQGDLGPLAAAVAPNITWTVPGNGRLAGDDHGLERILGLFETAPCSRSV